MGKKLSDMTGVSEATSGDEFMIKDDTTGLSRKVSWADMEGSIVFNNISDVDVTTTTPEPGHYLAWDTNTSQWVNKNVITSDGLQRLYYRWKNTVASNPASGKIYFNNATYSSVTEMYVHGTTYDGIDIGNLAVSLLDTTKRFFLQTQSDGSKWVQYDISGTVTLSSGILTIPVTYVSDSGTALNSDKDTLILVGTRGITSGQGADLSEFDPNSGLRYNYSNTTTAGADSGTVRFNNGTAASATAMYVSETTSNGTDFSDFLDLSLKSHTEFIMYKVADPTKYVKYKIKGHPSDNGNYRTASLTYITGTTFPSDGDPVAFRSGDASFSLEVAQDLEILDNTANSYRITDGTENYVSFTTTTGAEAVTFSQDVSINADLSIGGDLTQTPSPSITPSNNGDLVIEATNNTTLTFKYKGTDGTVRSGTVTLS